MSWIEIISERKTREAQEEGAFDNLPGRGKPLNLETDSRVPAELRAAYRIMKEAQVLPDWIQLDKEIRQHRTQWDARLESYLQSRGDDLEADEPSRSRQREEFLDRKRDVFLLRAAEALREINRLIDRLNLIVPTPSQQRVRVNLRERMRELEERLPRFRPYPPGSDAPWSALLEESRPRTQLSNRVPLGRKRRKAI
jgi:hypothetical protein